MSTEPWLEPLYDADGMRALDRWAIERQGIPSLELMERAGAQVAEAVIALAPAGAVRAVCGRGNNGGDGLVVVRLLREHGLEAEALLVAGTDLSEDARANLVRLRESGADAREVGSEGLPGALAGASVVVDAMLGTGFSGSPRAPLDAAIDAVNGCGATVVAVDVPSGVDASTGEVAGACVRADVTVTFDSHKLGLWINPGKAHAGRVEAVDIGIPAAGEQRPAGLPVGLIGRDVLSLLPARDTDSNKFKSGAVLAVGGATGLTGAVCLACEASMRAGAGWVRAGVPASLNQIFEIKLTEVMSVPLADRDGHLLAEAADSALEATERADAVALGPGIGREDGTTALVARLVHEIERPLVIDADGLFALAQAGLEAAAGRSAPTVLTPHTGELGRLLGTESREVDARRLAGAREAAARARAVVVLKGDDTIVAGPGGELGISRGGTPALATAGTGDVLTGIVAAFLARGLEPFPAACAAVHAHAEAGREAERRLGVESVLAGDVIAALPAVMKAARATGRGKRA